MLFVALNKEWAYTVNKVRAIKWNQQLTKSEQTGRVGSSHNLLWNFLPKDIVTIKNILVVQITTEKKIREVEKCITLKAVPEQQNVRCVFLESIVTCVAASARAMADQCPWKNIRNREKADTVILSKAVLAEAFWNLAHMLCGHICVWSCKATGLDWGRMGWLVRWSLQGRRRSCR